MRRIEATGQFKKDYKRVKKRGYDMSLLGEVLRLLQEDEKLPIKNKDHGLVGKYIGYRECHILSDWLLIYAKSGDNLTLVAFRTGSHSDLFG